MTAGRIPSIEGGIQPTLLSTTGDIMYASSASNPARLAIGSSAQVLTVASGIPAWATASTGAMVLITRQSFSNVTTTTTTFDSIFSTTYGSYLVVIESMYAGTAADDLHCQFRYAGPTTQAASYFGNDLSTESGTTTTTNAAQSNTAFAVLSRYTGPSTNPGQGQFSVFNASGVSAEPSIVSSYIEGGRGASVNSIVSTLAARIYTGLIFKSSSSNITGTVSVYGLVKV